MRHSLRLVLIAVGILTCGFSAAIAQVDRENFALLFEGKTLQRNSAEERFESLKIHAEALQQMLAEDRRVQANKQQEFEDANDALIRARDSLAEARFSLALAEAELNSLRSQMVSADLQISAQLTQIALLADCRAFFEAEYESWDELLKTTVFSGQASGFQTREEIEAMLGTILQQLDAIDAATDFAIAQFQQAEVTYYLCESSIPDAELAVQAAEFEVASAREANERAVAEFNERAQELGQADREVALDEQDLWTLFMEIQEAETIFLAQWMWLLSNPTYEAWVANGYPDPGNG